MDCGRRSSRVADNEIKRAKEEAARKEEERIRAEIATEKAKEKARLRAEKAERDALAVREKREKRGSRDSQRSSKSSAAGERRRKNKYGPKWQELLAHLPEAEEDFHVNDLQTTTAAPAYKELAQNKYKYPLQRETIDAEDLPQCGCAFGSGCGEQCTNRLLYMECSPDYCPSLNCTSSRAASQLSEQSSEYCQNTVIQRKAYPYTEVFYCGSAGHGLRLLEDVPKGTKIIEYLGEVITSEECSDRMTRYSMGNHFYFASLGNGLMLDAARMGSTARFANHSCNPTCELQKWSVIGESRIVLVSLRALKKGTEITYNYQYFDDGLDKPKQVSMAAASKSGKGSKGGPNKRKGGQAEAVEVVMQRQPCLCGSYNCCGTIGGRVSRTDEEVWEGKARAMLGSRRRYPLAQWHDIQAQFEGFYPHVKDQPPPPPRVKREETADSQDDSDEHVEDVEEGAQDGNAIELYFEVSALVGEADRLVHSINEILAVQEASTSTRDTKAEKGVIASVKAEGKQHLKSNVGEETEHFEDTESAKGAEDGDSMDSCDDMRLVPLEVTVAKIEELLAAVPAGVKLEEAAKLDAMAFSARKASRALAELLAPPDVPVPVENVASIPEPGPAIDVPALGNEMLHTGTCHVVFPIKRELEVISSIEDRSGVGSAEKVLITDVSVVVQPPLVGCEVKTDTGIGDTSATKKQKILHRVLGANLWPRIVGSAIQDTALGVSIQVDIVKAEGETPSTSAHELQNVHMPSQSMIVHSQTDTQATHDLADDKVEPISHDPIPVSMSVVDWDQFIALAKDIVAAYPVKVGDAMKLVHMYEECSNWCHMQLQKCLPAQSIALIVEKLSAEKEKLLKHGNRHTSEWALMHRLRNMYLDGPRVAEGCDVTDRGDVSFYMYIFVELLEDQLNKYLQKQNIIKKMKIAERTTRDDDVIGDGTRGCVEGVDSKEGSTSGESTGSEDGAHDAMEDVDGTAKADSSTSKNKCSAQAKMSSKKQKCGPETAQDDDEELHCFCMLPESDSLGNTMVQCDICDKWYHLQCMNVSQTGLKSMTNSVLSADAGGANNDAAKPVQKKDDSFACVLCQLKQNAPSSMAMAPKNEWKMVVKDVLPMSLQKQLPDTNASKEPVKQPRKSPKLQVSSDTSKQPDCKSKKMEMTGSKSRGKAGAKPGRKALSSKASGKVEKASAKVSAKATRKTKKATQSKRVNRVKSAREDEIDASIDEQGPDTDLTMQACDSGRLDLHEEVAVDEPTESSNGKRKRVARSFYEDSSLTATCKRTRKAPKKKKAVKKEAKPKVSEKKEKTQEEMGDKDSGVAEEKSDAKVTIDKAEKPKRATQAPQYTGDKHIYKFMDEKVLDAAIESQLSLPIGRTPAGLLLKLSRSYVAQWEGAVDAFYEHVEVQQFSGTFNRIGDANNAHMNASNESSLSSESKAAVMEQCLRLYFDLRVLGLRHSRTADLRRFAWSSSVRPLLTPLPVPACRGHCAAKPILPILVAGAPVAGQIGLPGLDPSMIDSLRTCCYASKSRLHLSELEEIVEAGMALCCTERTELPKLKKELQAAKRCVNQCSKFSLLGGIDELLADASQLQRLSKLISEVVRSYNALAFSLQSEYAIVRLVAVADKVFKAAKRRKAKAFISESCLAVSITDNAEVPPLSMSAEQGETPLAVSQTSSLAVSSHTAIEGTHGGVEKAGEEAKEEEEEDASCWCDRGDDGTDMIFCEGCKVWFHTACVGVTLAKRKKKASASSAKHSKALTDGPETLPPAGPFPSLPALPTPESTDPLHLLSASPVDTCSGIDTAAVDGPKLEAKPMTQSHAQAKEKATGKAKGKGKASAKEKAKKAIVVPDDSSEDFYCMVCSELRAASYPYKW